MVDHYATLGLSRDASAREVGRAYRRLARRYHPDVSTSPTVTIDLFLAVQAAYETLSDPRRRAGYDEELERREQAVASAGLTRGWTSATASSVERTAAAGVGERPAPETRASTAALSLLLAASVAVILAPLLADVLSRGAGRFLWLVVVSLLALGLSTYARSLASRQLDRLWRWTAGGGRATLARSAAAQEASRRIRLADDVTLHGRRLVLLAVPIAFLIVVGR